MIYQAEVRVYRMTDGHGDQWVAVTDEGTDYVVLNGVDRQGQRQQYEGDHNGIDVFCRKHGFKIELAHIGKLDLTKFDFKTFG